ncbi:hypothetical protein [Nevskia ramosa]|uniref:hypothetical protein n=1 Tax=Nevskia ramosa TaxID=64002 RepID=UPI002357C7CE|nr:hypothetical protein [Nevskia ramosa]
MSFGDLSPGEVWSILSGLCSAGAVVYVWLHRRSNVTNETITAIETRQQLAEQRLTVVEQAQLHAPKADDLTAIREGMSAISMAVAGLEGKVGAELGGLNRQLGLIQEHLLNRNS